MRTRKRTRTRWVLSGKALCQVKVSMVTEHLRSTGPTQDVLQVRNAVPDTPESQDLGRKRKRKYLSF